MTGKQEAEGEEGVGNHLGQDKLSQSAEYSAGMEGDNGGDQARPTHLVELVAQVDWVDVIWTRESAPATNGL